MRTLLSRSVVLSVMVSAIAQLHADPFRNLDFESADDTKLLGGGNFGTVSDLLPGWQLYQGTVPVSYVTYDTHNSRWASSGWLATSENTFPVFYIEGRFAFYYRIAYTEDPEGRLPFRLVQRGDVPQFSQVLSFRENYVFGGPWSPRVDGVSLRLLTREHSFSGYISSYDVSQYAGRNVELELTTSPSTPAGNIYGQIDSIMFTVPEPSPVVLFGMGGAVLALVAAFRHSRHQCCEAVRP